VVSFPPVSPPRPYTPPYPQPYAPHAQPISFFLILSPAQSWVRSTDHLAPRYAISSIPPLPRPSSVIGFRNWHKICLLCDTDWIFKYNSSYSHWMGFGSEYSGFHLSVSWHHKRGKLPKKQCSSWKWGALNKRYFKFFADLTLLKWTFFIFINPSK